MIESMGELETRPTNCETSLTSKSAKRFEVKMFFCLKFSKIENLESIRLVEDKEESRVLYGFLILNRKSGTQILG